MIKMCSIFLSIMCMFSGNYSTISNSLWTPIQRIIGSAYKEHESAIQPKISLKQNATKEEFVAFCEENYDIWKGKYTALSFGLMLSLDWENETTIFSNNEYSTWYLVDEENILCMDDVYDYWYQYFARTSDVTKLESTYQETHGRVYALTTIAGFGDGLVEKNIFDGFEKSADGKIIITGFCNCYDSETGEFFEKTPIECVLVLQDNLWVCESIK